jgi:kinesin family member 5
MESELNELKVQLEKVTYENKEGAITMDSLREANLELSGEIDGLKVMEIHYGLIDSNYLLTFV